MSRNQKTVNRMLRIRDQITIGIIKTIELVSQQQMIVWFSCLLWRRQHVPEVSSQAKNHFYSLRSPSMKSHQKPAD